MLNINKLENIKDKGNSWVAACPCCRTDKGLDKKGNHLIVYKDGGKFGCCIDNSVEHNKRIIELVGTIETDSTVDTVIPIRPVQPQFYPESALIRLLPEYSYWVKRGISAETLRKFKGGLAQMGKFRAFFTIPVYDDKNRIVGFTGRYTLNCEKYKKPKFNHTAGKSSWVFPIHLNKQSILNKREIILTEGIADGLTLTECGIDNYLLMFGASLSSKLLNAIIGLNPRKVIIATNSDTNHTVGQDAAIKIKDKLSKFFDSGKIEIRLPPTKDINNLLNTENGQEKIRQLYGN